MLTLPVCAAAQQSAAVSPNQ